MENIVNWKHITKGAVSCYTCIDIESSDAIPIDHLSGSELSNLINTNDSFKLHPLSNSIGLKEVPSVGPDFLEKLPSGIYSIEEFNYEYVLSPRIIENREYKYYPEVSKSFFETLKTFIKREDIYKTNNWRYKLGCLLYGPPGASKTSSLNYAIHNIFPKDSIVILTRGRLPSDELIETLNRSNKDSLIILIFEELATAIDSEPRSIPKMLDLLDGESSFNRFIAIATTNYPENLPGSLSNRRGRFDKLFNFKEPSKVEVKIILESLINREATEAEVLACDKFSISDIKSVVECSLMEELTLVEAAKSLKDLAKVAGSHFKKESKMGF